MSDLSILVNSTEDLSLKIPLYAYIFPLFSYDKSEVTTVFLSSHETFSTGVSEL